MKILLCCTAAALLGFQAASAQTGPQVKVDVKDLKVEAYPTPQISSNVPEKRWRPKTWFGLDLEFEIKLPPAEGGRNGSLDTLTVNYYLALNHTTKENKREVLKGTFNYIDIPASETCHAMAFVSPAALRRIFQKDNFTVSTDVQGWGVEVLVNGEVVAGKSSIGNNPWWKTTENFAMIDGVLLPKQETPFAILWGDYDVQAKK